MTLDELFSNYKNHPVLFVGAGFTKRFTENSPSWGNLLEEIVSFYSNDPNKFNELKGSCYKESRPDWPHLGGIIEEEFRKSMLEHKSEEKWKSIYNRYIDVIKKSLPPVDPVKFFVADRFKDLKLKNGCEKEIESLKKALKNIAAIITTNYDTVIEKYSGYNAVIGNDILDSPQYRVVYKIHGCTNHPEKIILTEKDYNKFDTEYQLISGHLISLFIHHPVIFIGYSADDKNVRALLATIFSGIDRNSSLYDKIRSNFLLVQYVNGTTNTTVVEDYEINLGINQSIGIKKIQLDDFSPLYNALTDIAVPATVEEITRVSAVVRDVERGGKLLVRIEEDFDKLDPNDRVIAIGSLKGEIRYLGLNETELVKQYFDYYDKKEPVIGETIDKRTIPSNNYFPIYAYATNIPEIVKSSDLKKQQIEMLQKHLDNIKKQIKRIKLDPKRHNSVDAIYSDSAIKSSYKANAVFYAVAKQYIPSDNLKEALLSKRFGGSDYSRLVSLYDFLRFGGSDVARLNVS